MLTVLLALSASAAPDVDPLTSLAVGATAYATLGVVHEVVGHGAGCATASGRPVGFSTVYMVCDTAGLGPGDIRFGTFAGTGANLGVGSGFATALVLSPPRDGWTYHYLWSSMSIQLFLSGSYMATGALFDNGDFGEYVSTVVPGRQDGTRLALALSGAAIISASFPLSIVLAEPMLGSDRRQRSRRKLALIGLPYLGVGIGLMAAGGALNKELGPGHGVAAALVGYGLGTVYFGSTMLMIPNKPPPNAVADPPALGRRAGWLVAGAASVVAIGVLGRGVGDLDDAPLDAWRDVRAHPP